MLNGAEKEGYKFEGWYTNGSFEGEKITAIEAGTFGNVVLYAKYMKGFTVSYVLNGGENNPDNPVYYFSDEETALLDPVKEGFVFGGWYLDEAKTELVSAIAVNTTGDVTLYAEWIEDVVESESDGKTESKASGGCGGSVGGIGMISVLLPGVAWFFYKKKEG